MKTIYPLFIAFGICGVNQVNAQCDINPFLIRSFEFNGSNYEIVLENRNWQDAANCSVARGGKLVEINSQQEQDAVYNAVISAFIDPANTIAPDGGNSSYLWLGGNDSSSEGNWVWNGDNDSQISPFWTGTSNGTSVNGSYENWGNEPDNWNNQDGLAMGLTDWPLGLSGQWNDVSLSNDLYYIIEYPPFSLGMIENIKPAIMLFPNPAKQEVIISYAGNEGPLVITDLSGKTVLTAQAVPGETVLDISTLLPGTYFVSAGQETKKLQIE